MSGKNLLESLEKLENIPRNVIVALVFVFLIIPILVPLNLPILVTQDVKDFYQMADQLPKGAVVAHSWDDTPTYWAQCGAASLSVFNVLLTKPVRNIFFSVYAPAPPTWQFLIKAATIPEGKKYGVDYVFLGYVAGDEAATAQLARNLRITRTDYLGTPLDKLPIMDGVRDYRDVALLVSHVGLPDVAKYYARQWNIPFHVPIVMIQTPVNSLMNLPFRAAGQIRYVFWANRGGAELETLMNKPGWGVANTDAQNFAHVLTIIMIVVGNIGYWARRKRGRA